MSNFKKRKNTLRLKGYDYSSSGAYFITIDLQDKKSSLGNVSENKMILNPISMMMDKWWLKIADKFPMIMLDEYKIMPNHIHGILMLIYEDLSHTKDNSKTIGDAIKWFKTMSTNEYIRGVKNKIFPPFRKKVFQRDFYDRVIRSEKELERIREYIFYNPLYWSWDKEKFEEYLKVKNH